MNFKEIVKDKNIHTIYIFVLGFLLLFLYHRYFSFMDEADNMLGALAIIDGKEIYKDYFAHHTPFVYYFMSIFAFLGVRDYETFRLCLAITIFFTCIFLYLRYSKFFSGNTFKFFIILYSLSLNYTWGQMILGDVFQGFALLILLLELLIYSEIKSLSIKSNIIISGAIFIAVFSAFTSVYPIFIACFCIFSYQIIKSFLRQESINLKAYFQLISIVAIPFIFFLLYYVITGNFKNFYEQAFQFNRLYYSNYINGFGTDSLAVFKDTLVNWFNHIAISLTSINKEGILNSLLIIFNLLFIYHYYKKDKILSIIIFLFMAYCGLRGYTGFHALAYYIVSFFCASFVIQEYLLNNKEIKEFKMISIKILTILLFIFSINSYLPNAGANILKSKGAMAQYYYDDYIQKLSNESDKIWISSLASQSYIQNHRKPAVRAFTLLPWFLDAWKDEILYDLKANRPKVIIFERDSDVWGYKYSEFGKVIFDYILSEYICLNEYDSTERNVYIRKDYYPTAKRILWPNSTQVEEGKLLSDGTKIYKIENGQKRWISSTEAFQKRGFKWDEVDYSEVKYLQKIMSGPPID